MEGFQKSVRTAMSQSKDSSDDLATALSSTFEKAKASFNNFSAAATTATPSNSIPADPPQLLLTRQSGKVVSLLTCSKLCAVFFVAGVFVGYTLKRRVRRWASKLLRGLKDE
ncbi:uncharacterized protein LOC113775466 [Coffea eugenioides]|uniref:uncharacterized protein LOC113775466 n=1 Tax=Coffea eugenioides TaxID=49369 RepID=UPI000F60DCF3|nr:uncharacterized protein LOC113775466 [Coffea eugenioides]